MNRSELSESVKVKLDESTPDGVSHSFDEYIDPLLDEAAKEMFDTVPIQLLVPTAIPVVADTNLFYENDLAYIQVPTSYSRIAEIKFANWSKPVRRALKPMDPEYDMQDNTYLKSGSGRPSVKLQYAIPAEESLGQFLVCGKVLEDEAVVIATYIKYDVAENLPEPLHEALTWLTTAKVLSVTGEDKAMQLAEKQYATTLFGK